MLYIVSLRAGRGDLRLRGIGVTGDELQWVWACMRCPVAVLLVAPQALLLTVAIVGIGIWVGDSLAACDFPPPSVAGMANQ